MPTNTLIFDNKIFEKKYKICIMASGETRTYNHLGDDNNPMFNGLQRFVAKLESLNFEVSVVGHTWAHVDPPIVGPNHLQFITKIDDQSIITDWVDEDALRRMPRYRSDDLANPPININDIDNFKTHHHSMARDHYGQIWSAMLSAEQAYNTTDADLYIRWRWDLEWLPVELDGISYGLNYALRLLAREGSSESIVAATSATEVSRDDNHENLRHIFLDDVFFVFTPPAIGKLLDSSPGNRGYWKHAFERAIACTDTRDETPQAHTLWNKFLFNLDIEQVLTSIPTTGLSLHRSHAYQVASNSGPKQLLAYKGATHE